MFSEPHLGHGVSAFIRGAFSAAGFEYYDMRLVLELWFRGDVGRRGRDTKASSSSLAENNKTSKVVGLYAKAWILDQRE